MSAALMIVGLSAPLVAITDASSWGLGSARTLGLATECLARGGSLDADFTLAFAVCAVALALGIGAVLAIPGKRVRPGLRVVRGHRTVPQSWRAPMGGSRADL